MQLEPSRDSPSSNSSSDYAEISGKMSEDFVSKLRFHDMEGGKLDEKANLEEIRGLSIEEEKKEQDDYDEEAEGDDEEEEEFSFVCTKADGSPISADDIFHDGQIRPMYPIFNQDLLLEEGNYGGSNEGDDDASSAGLLRPPLKKLFVHERDVTSSSSSSFESDELQKLPQGTYCVWKGKKTAVPSPPETCKKSNSTGFSKLWRIRDLALRSNSDGKDVFVYANPTAQANRKHSDGEKEKASAEDQAPKEERKGKAKKMKGKTASSSHQEKAFARYQAKKEGDKRKSYLPYRKDLVGFFTSVNGLTRNVHPF